MIVRNGTLTPLARVDVPFSAIMDSPAANFHDPVRDAACSIMGAAGSHWSPARWVAGLVHRLPPGWG
jgi:hypothetical protein